MCEECGVTDCIGWACGSIEHRRDYFGVLPHETEHPCYSCNHGFHTCMLGRKYDCMIHPSRREIMRKQYKQYYKGDKNGKEKERKISYGKS